MSAPAVVNFAEVLVQFVESIATAEVGGSHCVQSTSPKPVSPRAGPRNLSSGEIRLTEPRCLVNSFA